MLPFLKHQEEAAVALPSKTLKLSPDKESDENDLLEILMEEFKFAVSSGDVKAMAEIFRIAFQLCELEPHNETPHLNEE